jgi:hypothetical protein
MNSAELTKSEDEDQVVGAYAPFMAETYYVGMSI